MKGVNYSYLLSTKYSIWLDNLHSDPSMITYSVKHWCTRRFNPRSNVGNEDLLWGFISLMRVHFLQDTFVVNDMVRCLYFIVLESMVPQVGLYWRRALTHTERKKTWIKKDGQSSEIYGYLVYPIRISEFRLNAAQQSSGVFRFPLVCSWIFREGLLLYSIQNSCTIHRGVLFEIDLVNFVFE